jgi:nitroreductase
MGTPSQDQLHRVVELACRAPSTHNTQPWRWRIVGDTSVELYADRSRQLAVADPDGRNLMISCGAVLHHALEAARSLGLEPTVTLSAVGSDQDLLARVTFSPAQPPADAATRLLIMEQRCTDRRRFTSWPVPDSRLNTLAQAAAGWGAQAIPITDVTARFRAELLMEQAMTLQAVDTRFSDEQAAWVERGDLDGIRTSNAVPPVAGRLAARPNRFLGETGMPAAERMVESSDGLMAICTAYDAPESWLQAGHTLSALWLHATRAGMSIVPLSQVIEVPETRDALHHDVFADATRPQLVLRVGWQEIARTTLPRTSRRPLADVLMRDDERAQVDHHE